MTSQRHRILCVDDEPNVLNALKRLLRREDFDIATAGSGREGLEVLAREPVHLVLCDQRMPEMSGNEFLARVRERYPDIVRISLTGYTEVDAITESINRGHIYKFFLKPWNDQQLKLEIRQALEYYDLSLDHRRLSAQLAEQNRALEAVNANLEAMVRERTEELAFRNRALEVSHAVLDNLPIPVAGISTEGIVVLANRAAQRYFGHPATLALGMRLEDGLPAAARDLVGIVMATGRPEARPFLQDGAGACLLQGIPLQDVRIGQGVILTAAPGPAAPACASGREA